MHKPILTLFTILFLLTGCTQKPEDKSVKYVLKESGENKEELLKVLKYYSNKKEDKLKLKAAKFLIGNMRGHAYRSSEQLDKYKVLIYNEKTPIPTQTLNDLWDNVKKENQSNAQRKQDLKEINSDFIIDNIEKAFKAWESAPWKEEISFTNFCKYILPYRVLNEPPVGGWRDSLQKRYGHLVEDVTDSKKAFVIIYQAIQKSNRLANSACPYNLDVLTMDYLGRGNCSQVCILTANVLRALAIPASYDYLNNWANYSRSGHSWVSYVDGNANTYTLAEGDSILRKNNPIDASSFKENDLPTNYPLSISTTKKVAKIYRKTYEYVDTVDTFNRTLFAYADRHSNDVSDQYNLKGFIELEADRTIEKVSLSIFITGDDWHEFVFATNDQGKARFENIGTDIVYLPQYYQGNEIIVGIPFLLTNEGKRKELKPSKETRKITLTRKYPLFTRWTTSWNKMIGGKFEGANTANFKDAVTLHTITNTPTGMTEIEVTQSNKFRYVRYVCPEKSRSPMAEIYFYSDTSISSSPLNGDYIGDKIDLDNVKHAFDGDRLSSAETKKEAYWLGIDLGKNKNQRINKIKFLPKNDGNFVEPGHQYELFYFDGSWKSLGVKEAFTDSISYHNIYKDALYLLKNYTSGKEERIFAYDKDKQVWW